MATLPPKTELKQIATPPKPALMPIHLFLKKFVRNLGIGFMFLILSLFGGMYGYHHYENMDWIDSYVNAAMILSGMGPVGTLTTIEGKIFAGSYALFSGIFFLIIMAIIISPIVARLMHTFHMEVPRNK